MEKTLEKMSRDEKSLLLYFETVSVDYGGAVDARRMNKEDFEIAAQWKKDGFIKFGRVYSKDLITSRTHWVEMTPEAWHLAHLERKIRAERMWTRRSWLQSDEKQLA